MPQEVTERPHGSWALVAVLCFAGMCVAFMQTLVVPIQNHLPVLVDAPRTATAWVLTIALLASAITTPISGRLGDIIGKRKVALAMFVLLITGSLIAALSDGLTLLLVGRALQGASMGIIAVGISILGDQPDPKQRITGIAFLSASLGFGGAIGLPIAGWIVEVGDWKLLFWFSVILGVMNFVLLWRYVPKSEGTRQRLDIVGALGLAAGLGGILVGVSQGPVWGWASLLTIGSIVGGIALLLGWGWFQLRVTDPIVDLRLLARRSLLLVNLGSIALGFSFFISEVALLQILELPIESEAGLGLTMFTASLALVPSALAMVAAAPLAAHFIQRYSARFTATLGALITAASYVATIVWHDEVWHIVVTSCFMLGGIGLGYSTIPTLIIAEVPRNATGSANGVNSLMRSVGTSMGATVSGMVLAATSIPTGGNEIPQPIGFVTVFILGAVAAIVSAWLIWASRSRA